MLINRFFDYWAKKTPIIVFTPCISVIGNCSEQLFSGFLKARREGKKLFIVYPFELPWKFRFPVTNREIFDVASALRRDIHPVLFFLARVAVTLFYGPIRCFDLIMGKL